MTTHILKYIQATGWFILSLVISCCNDAITKYLGYTLDPWQIIFFRFSFGIITLVPFILYKGKQAFNTSRWLLHIGRGILLFLAIGFWTEGIKTSPITTATVMSFSIPLFVLLLSSMLLKEKVSWPMWVSTGGGFIGIVLLLQPSVDTFHPRSCFFVMAVILFSLLDILNKKYVAKESTLSMLLYSSIVALIFTTYPAIKVWQNPTLLEWSNLLILGIGGNLILYFLLRAFALANASALVPFRYLELLLSMLVSYFVFQELPTMSGYIGSAVIIPCTLFIWYLQAYKASKRLPKISHKAPGFIQEDISPII